MCKTSTDVYSIIPTSKTHKEKYTAIANYAYEGAAPNVSVVIVVVYSPNAFYEMTTEGTK